MKILHLTIELPFFPGGLGGNIREFSLLSRLAGRHSFSVAALRPTTAERIARIEALGVSVIHAPIEAGAARNIFFTTPAHLRYLTGKVSLLLPGALPPVARDLLRDFEPAAGRIKPLLYDLIQVEHTLLLPVVDRLRRTPGCPPIILTAHNIESHLAERMSRVPRGLLYRLNDFFSSRRMLGMERRLLRRPRRVVAMSEEDRVRLIDRFGLPAGNIAVVPNGVDCDYFGESIASPVPGRVVFTGAFDYGPNREGVLWFRREVFPLLIKEMPGIAFHLAGALRDQDSPVARPAWPDNESSAFNVPDIRPHIQSAEVVAVPLLAGSGTRLKILEAMASGRPVVSTTIGAEGLGAAHGETILIADEPHEMAMEILRLLRDPGTARRMGERAREWVRKGFDWSILADRMDRVYAGLAEEEGRTSR